MIVHMYAAPLPQQSIDYIIDEIETTQAEMCAIRSCQRMVSDLLDSASADRKFVEMLAEKQTYFDRLWAEMYRRGFVGYTAGTPIPHEAGKPFSWQKNNLG